MLEPYEGRVFDPCSGSGGMFVQSEKFINALQDRYKKFPSIGGVVADRGGQFPTIGGGRGWSKTQLKKLF